MYTLGFCSAPHAVDVQQYIQLLSDANKASSPETSFAIGSTISSSSTVDEVARWWGSVISIAAFWLQGDDQAAGRLYATVDAFPKHLQNMEYVQSFCPLKEINKLV